MLLLVEQIFCLVEISFRNCILLCVTTVIASCRKKLLMQNLISAYINFWVVETIRSIFFRQTKVTFPSSENIYFNECFIPASGNLFSV